MLDPDAYSAILIEKRGNGVVIATLNRPETSATRSTTPCTGNSGSCPETPTSTRR